MSQKKLDNTGVVILAAGRGSRLGCTDIPKVMLELAEKPVIGYTIETLEAMGFTPEQIVVVVGFKRDVVMDYFGDRVTYAIQHEQHGTAHAAFTGIEKLSNNIEDVLVLGGDDSAFYTAPSLQSFIDEHIANDVVLSLLTAEVTNPKGLGRVVRHENGDIEVIEKEYVTPEQKEIKEISTGTFCFDKQWFEDIFPRMPQLRKLGEYGLPTALAMARDEKKPHQVVQLDDSKEWFGINTPEQLEEAQKIKHK